MFKAMARKAFKCHMFGDFRCIICARFCASEPALCQGCCDILPWLDPSVCLSCGCPNSEPCSRCADRVDPFEHRFALFDYSFPTDALLKRLKYSEKRAIGRNLGLLLGSSAALSGAANGAELLLPVPLAWSRRRARGFNQAADIAQACSDVLGIAWTDKLLHRHARTPRLAGLSPVERRFALLGAFAASSEVSGKHVVLVDDVMTSGATCLELNRELKDRGASAVSVWTVARTVLPDARVEYND